MTNNNFCEPRPLVAIAHWEGIELIEDYPKRTKSGFLQTHILLKIILRIYMNILWKNINILFSFFPKDIEAKLV